MLATKLIIKGIHEGISFHTNGGDTRTIAAETFVENVVMACMFKTVKGKYDVSDINLNRLLGASTHQISGVRETVLLKSQCRY